MNEGEFHAVVLRRAAMRESDLVVVLFGEGVGKLPTVARGARRSKRRFAGGLPVGARGAARISRGRGQMPTLAAFEPLHDHARIGRSLLRYAYVNYICELADRLSVERAPDLGLLRLLFAALEATEAEELEGTLLRVFELGMLDLLGWLPELRRCAACHELVEGDGERVWVDWGRGGALCPRHVGDARPLSREHLGDLEDLAALARGWSQTGRPAPVGPALPRVPSARRLALRTTCQALLRPHLNRPLRSAEFFRALARTGPGTGGPEGPAENGGS